MAISETRKMTTEKLRNKIFELVGNEYELLSEYVNYETKVDIRHSICGHNYKVKYSNFLSGKRCPKCFGTPKKSTDQFKIEIDLHSNQRRIYGSW